MRKGTQLICRAYFEISDKRRKGGYFNAHVVVVVVVVIVVAGEFLG